MIAISSFHATAKITAEIKEMHNALRRLRGIVLNVYENNPAKLAEWKTASHIKEPPVKKKDDKPE